MIKEVHEWSKKTFGAQSAMRPLLGIAEEIGEYLESLGGPEADTVDALADIGIFFCDFCGISGVSFDFKVEGTTEDYCNNTTLFMAYADVCHVVLKTEQKIKGMDDPTKAKAALEKAVAHFWEVLVSFCHWNHKLNLQEAMKDVFSKVVAKRTPSTLKAAPMNTGPKTLGPKGKK